MADPMSRLLAQQGLKVDVPDFHTGVCGHLQSTLDSRDRVTVNEHWFPKGLFGDVAAIFGDSLDNLVQDVVLGNLCFTGRIWPCDALTKLRSHLLPDLSRKMTSGAWNVHPGRDARLPSCAQGQ